MNYGSVHGMSAVICLILLGIKGYSVGGVNMINGLLLVPFFICLMPVLSALFCDELYIWNRWKMRFEPLDKEDHPVAWKLYFGFFALASITFLVMFLIIK